MNEIQGFEIIDPEVMNFCGDVIKIITDDFL